MFVLVQNPFSVSVVFTVTPTRVWTWTAVLRMVVTKFVPIAPNVSGLNVWARSSSTARKFVAAAGDAPNTAVNGESGASALFWKYFGDTSVRMVRGPMETVEFVSARPG